MLRATRWILALLILSGGAYAAESYVDLWGPPVGSEIPVLDAVDAGGEPRGLEDLVGEKGLLLFFNRSTDW